MASKKYWLVKQEPESYPWAQFVREEGAAWTGVRNFQARNNLRNMAKGDLVLYYHSGDAKEVVGLAKVEKTAYADPTATEGDWSAVDLRAIKALKHPVPLQTIKADENLKDIALVRNSRLSVTPLTPAQFRRLMKLAKTTV
jgi:predicted RNA-binding protein with PUA-like domain